MYAILEWEPKNIRKNIILIGATTLNTNHILFRDTEVEISFIGKKSIPNTSIIKQENAIKLLEELCHKHQNKEYLFYYQDERNHTTHHLNSSHISNYLKKYHKNLKPKMFRTWNGNSILLKYLLSQKKPSEDREIKKNLREGIKKVAHELHNTVSVSKKSYCNSEIYHTYLHDNDKFFKFIDDNRRLNGDKKRTDRILTLFLMKYYQYSG